MKRVNSYGHGDHIIHVKIMSDSKISEEEQALYLALAEISTNTSGTIRGMTQTKEGEYIAALRHEFGVVIFLFTSGASATS